MALLIVCDGCGAMVVDVGAGRDDMTASRQKERCVRCGGRGYSWWQVELCDVGKDVNAAKAVLCELVGDVPVGER